MKKIYLFVLLVGFLTGCADGVPHVEDPSKPIDANGNPIKGTDFLQQYCQGKPTNEDCVKVQRAVSANSTKGGLPKGW